MKKSLRQFCFQSRPPGHILELGWCLGEAPGTSRTLRLREGEVGVHPLLRTRPHEELFGLSLANWPPGGRYLLCGVASMQTRELHPLVSSRFARGLIASRPRGRAQSHLHKLHSVSRVASQSSHMVFPAERASREGPWQGTCETKPTHTARKRSANDGMTGNAPNAKQISCAVATPL